MRDLVVVAPPVHGRIMSSTGRRKLPFASSTVLAITLATGTTPCSRADGDPMPYEKVVDAVRSIAYEPDRLSELLGHQVIRCAPNC